MQANWQEEIPTFSDICYDVKALNSFLSEISREFYEVFNKNGSHEVIQVNQHIINQIDEIARLGKFIQKKLYFFGFQEQVERNQCKTLSQMLFLPFNYVKNQEIQVKKRKSSYIPRQKNRGPYRSYAIQEKNHVVYLHQIGLKFASISKRLSIPQKNVVRWCKQGFLGKNSTNRIADIKMQEKLGEWLRKFKSIKQIKQNEIQEKALKLTSNKHFKASRGWLKNFMKRFFKEDLRISQQNK